MKNMTPDQFVWSYSPCDEGAAFASKYPTMYDCYEALLRGEAGANSFDWALWVLGELAGRYEDLMLWFVGEIQPMLPEEVRGMVNLNSFYFDDSNDPERRLFNGLLKVSKAFAKSWPPQEPEQLREALAAKTCLAALQLHLDPVGYYSIRTILVDDCITRGEAPPRLLSSYIITGEAPHGLELPKEIEDRFLGRLREFGNPFEKEIA